MNASWPETIQRCMTGEATADEIAGLQEALKNDPALRSLYLDYLNLDAALESAANVAAMRKTAGVLRAKGARRMRGSPFPFARWVAGIAAAAAVVVLFFLMPAPAPVATLARVADAVWSSERMKPGAGLAPGWLHLRSGLAEITFSRGARVILEGPSEFQLVSNNEALLRRGKLSASVPATALGFTIRGEGFSVIDHGTEFGVIAGEQPEVHVMSGTVSVVGKTERLLAKAEAVRFSAGKMEAIVARPELFRGVREFARLEASAALTANPATLVHFNFEQSPALRNLANPGVPVEVLGCVPAEGRWPGKGALEFKQTEDRVRFTVSGEMQSLTLLAWVRVDQLPNTQSSLLTGGSELPGEVHWFLHRDGTVIFSVIGADGEWHWATAPLSFRPQMFGKWLSFAVTFDGASGMATHYFNGQPIGSVSLRGVGPLRLRTVEIGNWKLQPGATLRASREVMKKWPTYVRNLRGRVDEFAILSAPLSAPEILRYFEASRPEPTPQK